MYVADKNCPVCGLEPERVCRCFLCESVCANGHEWYYCPKHSDRIILGCPEHFEGNFTCRCSDANEPILDFRNQYWPFSNFSKMSTKVPERFVFTIQTILPTLEHSFVVMKVGCMMEFMREANKVHPELSMKDFRVMSPGKVKVLGHKVNLREDWEDVKIDVMRSLLRQKMEFSDFRDLLLGTNQRLLVEGNTWHDQFWGDCLCSKHKDTPGQNWLGKLLMELREECLYF